MLIIIFKLTIMVTASATSTRIISHIIFFCLQLPVQDICFLHIFAYFVL